MLEDIVVAAVVADVVQSGSGVDKHRYHGMWSRVSAPQEATRPGALYIKAP